MIKKVFFVLLAAGTIYLVLLLFLSHQTIQSGLDEKSLIENYYSYQSTILLSNIIVFFVLLVFSNLLYYKQKGISYIVFSVVLFMLIAICNNWLIARPFFSGKENIGPSSSEYNLSLMLSVFYIIAAIAIAAISAITVRNLKSRAK